MKHIHVFYATCRNVLHRKRRYKPLGSEAAVCCTDRQEYSIASPARVQTYENVMYFAQDSFQRTVIARWSHEYSQGAHISYLVACTCLNSLCMHMQHPSAFLRGRFAHLLRKLETSPLAAPWSAAQSEAYWLRAEHKPTWLPNRWGRNRRYAAIFPTWKLACLCCLRRFRGRFFYRHTLGMQV